MLGDLEQVAGRARRPIETVNHDHVPLTYLVEQGHQLRPVVPDAGELLLVEAPAAGLFQCGALQREVLVIGADPGAADEHGEPVADIVAKRLPSATDICN